MLGSELCTLYLLKYLQTVKYRIQGILITLENIRFNQCVSEKIELTMTIVNMVFRFCLLTYKGTVL